MNNLILKSPQSWQTSACLPFVQITGTVVEWDEIHFDVRLLQRVPVSIRPARRTAAPRTRLTAVLAVRSTKGPRRPQSKLGQSRTRPAHGA